MMHINIIHDEGVNLYLLFCMAAIIVIIAGAALAARKSTFSFRDLVFIVCVCVPAAIIGSKVALFDSSQWLSFFSDGHLPGENSKSLLGAIAGIIFGAWIAGKVCGKKESILDLIAISFPIGMAVQRFGCLFGGCCHGIVTSMPWGITYGQGSRPFIEQQQLGLIPADAATSLAVHPDQIYNSIACAIIAVIVWQTRSRWKSPSGRFLFSISLYLGFRFIEEFFRFRLQTQIWMGLSIVQWIVLSLFVSLSLFLLIRERKYVHLKLVPAEIIVPTSLIKIRLFFSSLVILFIALRIGDWLTADERTIMLYTVFPLCGFLLIDGLLQSVWSQRFVRTGSLVFIAFILMSQRADKPPGTPQSYTAFDLSTVLGKYTNDHDFNYRTETCPEDNSIVEHSDVVPYRHNYTIGGIGVGRKIYYNQWQSLWASLNLIAGGEMETPLRNINDSMIAPGFNTKLLSINPMIQYDGRGIGLGIGASIGILGHDIADDPSDHRDYDPKIDVRKFSLQTRLRLFSERHSFIEVLGGYDVGSVGEYNWQLLYGNRFNSDKYMLKAGFGWSKYGGKSYVLRGQMQLTPKLFLSPEFMFGRKYYTSGSNTGRGNRVALTLQYRINDKKH
ncbi:MAG: prolipoprotein diacylglyceryl transferase family protein [Saprospiraceae bacterium]